MAKTVTQSIDCQGWCGGLTSRGFCPALLAVLMSAPYASRCLPTCGMQCTWHDLDSLMSKT
eukprot:scaffold137337_cov23-Tisochrysis_lutea.AAC.1